MFNTLLFNHEHDVCLLLHVHRVCLNIEVLLMNILDFFNLWGIHFKVLTALISNYGSCGPTHSENTHEASFGVVHYEWHVHL